MVTTKRGQFTVLSYNILSDDLSSPDYINVSPKHLNDAARLKLLLKIITKHIGLSTIFCFQETSGAQLSGLCGLFYDHQFYYVGIGDLAVFFPFKTFHLVGVHGNHYPGAVAAGLVKGLTARQSKILASRKKYFLGVQLQHTESKKVFTVATTHIIASPTMNDLKELETVALMKLFPKGPLVVCGDFNAMPSYSHIKAIPKGAIDTATIKAKFRPLKPVYKRGVTTHVTTHTSNKTTDLFSEIVDHIFHSDHLKVASSLPQMVKKSAALMPNKSEPSDHCIIGATFVFV